MKRISYSNIIGSLMYVMVYTRSDTTYMQWALLVDIFLTPVKLTI